jgi:hypothetical protein
MFLPADAQRPGTLLVVLAGTREDLDPTRWRIRRYRGDLFPLALGLELPGRWFPPQTVNIVFKNLQLVDMTPIDEGDGTTGVLLVDGCRFGEGAARPGFRGARSRELEWAHYWLRIPERFFTTDSAEAQADSHFHFYSRLPPVVAADGAGDRTTVAGARNNLEELLRAYKRMLAAPDTTEGQLHSFLKQHPECFGVFPWAHEECPIRDPSTSKTKYWADFAFRRPEGDYDFYEIEKSGDRVFRTSGDLTAKTNHALEQVENWLRTLTSNLRKPANHFRV